jgi:hypothetical protein
VNRDPHVQHDSKPGLDGSHIPRHPVDHSKGRADSAARVIFVGNRESEKGQKTVAEGLLSHFALEGGFNHILTGIPVLAEQQHHVFRVVSLRQRGKPC